MGWCCGGVGWGVLGHGVVRCCVAWYAVLCRAVVCWAAMCGGVPGRGVPGRAVQGAAEGSRAKPRSPPGARSPAPLCSPRGPAVGSWAIEKSPQPGPKRLFGRYISPRTQHFNFDAFIYASAMKTCMKEGVFKLPRQYSGSRTSVLIKH